MSIGWLITNIFANLLLPPLNGLLLVALGWALRRRRPRTARALGIGGFALLLVLSLPVVGRALLRTLEGEPLPAPAATRAQAIVVLGNGRHRDAPEYGGDTVSEGTLLRLRYAAKLQHETGLPLLVSGGRPDGGELSEAETMRRALVADFGVPVRWVEGESNTTRENARNSAALLKRDGVGHVLLVTHAWHMPRAVAAHEAAGLTVSPAPTFFHRQTPMLLDFMPRGYRDSRDAMHEWIGLLWYRLRG